MTPPDRPVLISLDDDSPPASPSEAPPVPDMEEFGRSTLQTAIQVTAARPSPLVRWFFRLLLALLVFGLSVAAWDFATGLIARNALLGWAATGLIGLFLAVAIAILVREAAALRRLSRIDALQKQASQAWANEDLAGARDVVVQLLGLYRGRHELRWAKERLEGGKAEAVDATSLLELAERELLAPLDAAATREIEMAARQVATVTALVPIALADVIAALTANMRMIRRIAEVYGGRGGTLGSWRLTRAVFSHLVATGVVAVGDDLLGSVAGGGVLSKISRRFGEGLINGALTARVGLAALDVCRPLAFHAKSRPSVSAVVKRALAGLFSKAEREG
ncbi:MAG: TIGR01620 family protein [Pseudomonadota bacterium]